MDDEVRVTLRMPAELHQRIGALAEKSSRSLNSQIVFLARMAVMLEESAMRRRNTGQKQ